MKDSIIIEGKEYISSRRASEMAKYSNDYVGQLCRMKKVESRKVGRIWFIEKESLLAHQRDAEVIIHSGPYINPAKPKSDAKSFIKMPMSSIAPSLPTTKYSSMNLMTHSASQLASFPVIVPDLEWKITDSTSTSSIQGVSRVRDPHDAIQKIKTRTRGIRPVFHHAQAFGTIALALMFVVVGTYSMTHPERTFGTVASIGHTFAQNFVSSSKEFGVMFASIGTDTMSASATGAIDPLKGNVLDDSRVGIVSSLLKIMGADISD